MNCNIYQKGIGWYANNIVAVNNGIDIIVHVSMYLASSPRPIFANFTERMTERNAKIGLGFHCRAIGAHALDIIQNLYNRQDIQNP